MKNCQEAGNSRISGDAWHQRQLVDVFSEITFQIFLSGNPLVVYFHDVLSDEAMNKFIKEASPYLEAPRTFVPKDKSVKSSSSGRSGKVAFVSSKGHSMVRHIRPEITITLRKYS